MKRTLAVIPEPVKRGPYAPEVLARVKVLAVAVVAPAKTARTIRPSATRTSTP